jgi:hypothetical protein
VPILLRTCWSCRCWRFVRLFPWDGTGGRIDRCTSPTVLDLAAVQNRSCTRRSKLIQYRTRVADSALKPSRNGSDSRTSYWPKSAIAFWEVVGEQKRSAGPETIPHEIIENVANFICNMANRRRPSLPARAPCRLTNSDWPSASEHCEDDWAPDHMSRHGGSKMNCRQPPSIIVT